MRKLLTTRILVVIMILSLFTLAAGCSNSDSSSDDPTVITDDAGREVTIEAAPERIVSLFPSHTEILFALGLGDKVVGVTDFDNYPEEVADIEKVGDSFNVNVEAILTLEPDLVLAPTGEAITQAIEVLGNSEINSLILEPKTIAEVEETITLLGEITGTEEQAEAVIAAMEAEKEEIAAAVEQQQETPKVLVLIDTASLYTVGSGEFIDELITLAGGENIASSYGEGYFIISEETILQENPDVIISTFPMKDDIVARENWHGINALQNDRIYDVNGDLVARQGPRITQGLQAIYDAIYPE